MCQRRRLWALKFSCIKSGVGKRNGCTKFYRFIYKLGDFPSVEKCTALRGHASEVDELSRHKHHSCFCFTRGPTAKWTQAHLRSFVWHNCKCTTVSAVLVGLCFLPVKWNEIFTANSWLYMRCSDVIDVIVITRRHIGGIQSACKN